MGVHLHELDNVFFEFIIRKIQKDPSFTEDEMERAFDYFFALEDAIEIGSYNVVIALMQSERPIPPKLLPLVAELLINNSQKQLEPGRRKIFSRFDRMMMFLEMKFVIKNGRKSSEVFEEFASKYGNKDSEPGPRFFQRLMEEFEEHPIAKNINPDAMKDFDWTKTPGVFVRT